jgi:hypothetical protein
MVEIQYFLFNSGFITIIMEEEDETRKGGRKSLAYTNGGHDFDICVMMTIALHCGEDESLLTQ